jgi:hypothetical protein
MAGDDWSEYRKLLLDTMQRLDAKTTDVQTQVHEINTQLASIKNDVQRHNNQDTRISLLEQAGVRYNTILAIIGAMAIGAWGFILKRLFDAE